MLRIFQYFLFFPYTFLYAWTPLGSIYNFGSNSVQKIKIVEKEYVIWKNGETITVQDNICPHRYAPLSEGRIEESGGHVSLQCKYHGWEFDKNGQCVKIPQKNANQKVDGICHLQTFETRITGDLLWADLKNYPPSIKDDAKSVMQEIEKSEFNTIPYIREVPYSWNFLLENFFDPAHIPFAHDGLQSIRTDGCPIPIQLLENNEKKISFLFHDVTRGVERDGKMEFFAPFFYKLSIRKNNEWVSNLNIFCIPICSGKSRVILFRTDMEPNPNSLERRESHQFSNAFFNTDDYLIHKQEINVSKKMKESNIDPLTLYKTPTTSDYAIKMVHKWMKKYYPKWMYFNTKELSKEDAIDNDKNHNQFCIDCSTKK